LYKAKRSYPEGQESIMPSRPIDCLKSLDQTCNFQSFRLAAAQSKKNKEMASSFKITKEFVSIDE
jgi:hypothetical protein